VSAVPSWVPLIAVEQGHMAKQRYSLVNIYRDVYGNNDKSVMNLYVENIGVTL
jgi:hypothetical protein